jgi:hypothetical protein
MPGNNAPIYSKSANVSWNTVNMTAANTNKDGTGVVDLIWTADVTNGGYLDSISIVPKGTNVATVMRFFVNNGSTNTVAANNSLIDHVGLPASTLSEVAATPKAVLNVQKIFPLGYRIYAVLGTAVAAGFGVTAYGGNY